MAILIVWCESRQVGRLSIEQGKFCFVYTDTWIKDKTAFELSPHFPFQSESFIDHSNDKRVEWFFENLLPEGGMREILARKKNLHKQDIIGLLSHFGEELAGALSLMHDGISFPTQQNYLSLSVDALREMITASKDSSLLVANHALHMSLAGVQNKLGVKYQDRHFFLPEGAAPSSHILKPDNNNPKFGYCPANEYFCMMLAKKLNLNVPDIELLHIPEPVYVIRRYDRVIEKASILRLHQIDLCQLLNKWEGYKYESHGGISLKDVFDAISRVTQPAVAKQQILNWTIFNYLIGNSDAHAKNLSFILTANSIRIAPFYDLLCVHAYLPDSQMAMYIDDEARPGWFTDKTWRTLSEIAQVPYRLLKSLLYKQIQNLDQKMMEVSALDSFTKDESIFINDKIIPIVKQRAEFIREGINETN